jgi:hypothetical protein
MTEAERLSWEAISNAAESVKNRASEVISTFDLPHVRLRPSLSIDGNKWCALYGENLQDGVAGFGASPAEALYDFDNAMHRKIPPPAPKETAPLERGYLESAESYAARVALAPAPRETACPNCENGSGWTRHLGRNNDEIVEKCHDHRPAPKEPPRRPGSLDMRDGFGMCAAPKGDK